MTFTSADTASGSFSVLLYYPDDYPDCDPFGGYPIGDFALYADQVESDDDLHNPDPTFGAATFTWKAVVGVIVLLVLVAFLLGVSLLPYYLD